MTPEAQAAQDRYALEQARMWGYNPDDPSSLNTPIERLKKAAQRDPYDCYRDRTRTNDVQDRQSWLALAQQLEDIQRRGVPTDRPQENPMKISQGFPSAGSYLAAKHMQPGHEYSVKIHDVTKENLEGEDPQPALAFVGKEKRLLLNKTNTAVLVDAFGDETDSWPGREIILFTTRVTFNGQLVPAIRVRIPPQTAPAQAAPTQQPAPAQVSPGQQFQASTPAAASDDPNDDIPW